jgi:uncharacterized protein with NAD-binding domain and iron-sulfur cluster
VVSVSESSTPVASGTSRRRFLSLTGAAVGGVGLAGLLGRPKPAGAASGAGRRVAILGGGVGGLTAAHELAERGFRVTVVEPKALGGKARSIAVPGTARAGRRNLPGEHGFRFFPGFYKNIPDTMRRIPVAGNPNGVLDHLVDAHQEVLTLPGGGQLWYLPSPDKYGALEGARSLITLIGIALGVPANEIEYFVRKMLVFLTSSDARRLGEWEYVSWTTFTNSEHFSPEYRAVFGTGLTKDLVAAKGSAASARTVGLMGEAFVYALMAERFPEVRRESGYGAADRLLNAPTNEAWIDPWVAHLRNLGVRFVHGHRVHDLTVSKGVIESVRLQRTDHNGAPTGAPDTVLDADWYVCAMPVEQMVRLLSPAVLAADPSLGRLTKLTTDWMNGIQFFLNRPPAVPVKGHVALLDTPWALTAIDQGLFWARDIAARYGDGTVRDIYSVDISDWFTPGIVFGRPAAECTPRQIAAEVWAQLKRALNSKQQTVLADDMIERWFLDPAIHYPHGTGRAAANREPLLINSAGSLDNRPEATTALPNLFLASDYVRTDIDLATMEGANEAGRKAANAILHAAGSSATPASLGTLWQPAELAVLRDTDAALYRAGLPNALDVVPAGVPI